MYGMNRQDSDEQVKATSGKGPLVKKLTRLCSTKHHPRLARIFRYILCFLFGGLIGLIPYFIFLVELCKGLQYSCIQEYAASLAVKNVYLPSSPNGDSDILIARNSEKGITKLPAFTRPPGVSMPASPVPTTLRKTLAPTRIVNKDISVEGKGNDDITLKCVGTMTVTRVIAFGIPGDQKAVSAFNKYCQANKEKLDKTNICFVSLKRVYKSNYPPFISTKVIYRCRYVTREPA